MASVQPVAQTAWDAEAAERNVAVCADTSLQDAVRIEAFVALLQMRLQCHLSNQRRDMACLHRLKHAIKVLRGEVTATQSAWRTLVMRGDRETQSDFEARRNQCNTALIAVAALIGWQVQHSMPE